MCRALGRLETDGRRAVLRLNHIPTQEYAFGMSSTCPCAASAGCANDPTTELFTAHRPAVIAYLRRRVPSAEAEDVGQEVLVRAARALPAFRGDASMRTWLLRIASRAALDHLRSRTHREARRTDPLPDGAGVDTATPSALATPAEGPCRIVRHEMHACVREFVDRLPATHREVLRLKDLEGLTNAETAARLGVTVETAKIRVHRARRELRALLDRGCDYYHGEDATLACDRKAPRATRKKAYRSVQ
jgi:RNA polymerase sigma-70 factor (ECF subfamily)